MAAVNYMATQDEKSQIAVLQTQMSTVIKGIDSINAKLDASTNLYVTQAEFREFKQRWFLSHAIVAFVFSLLTGLIVHFFARG